MATRVLVPRVSFLREMEIKRHVEVGGPNTLKASSHCVTKTQSLLNLETKSTFHNDCRNLYRNIFQIAL